MRAVVTREMMEAFVAANPTPQLAEVKRKTERYSAAARAFDLSAWISERLPDAKERTWNEGRKWILPTCPFEQSHDRGEAYVCQLHSGAIAAGCQHDSCSWWGWQELRDKLEPERAERRQRAAERPVSHREPPPNLRDGEVVYEHADWSSIEAEIDRQADADRDPPPTKPLAWRTAPEIVDEIWSRKDDPWVTLKLAEDVLCRVRAGGMAVLIGGPASGKTSLAANLLIDHARHVGPAIGMSIELPADELAARIAGVRVDAGWEDVLRGQMPYEHLRDALALPRLYVIERDRASLPNLKACIEAAQTASPGEPILVAIDYVQLLKSNEREIRLRVSDVLEQIDRLLRDTRVVGLVLSQMGRQGAKSARAGDAIGTDASELGAESSAIERFATVTFTIGLKGEPREDGSQAVELSIGKARMGAGDGVIPMSFWGKSGLWRVSGDQKAAAVVREERDEQREAKIAQSIEHQILGAVAVAKDGLVSRNGLCDIVTGRKSLVMKAIAKLLQSGGLVEVNRRAPRSRSWMLSTPDRAATLGLELIRDMPGTES